MWPGRWRMAKDTTRTWLLGTFMTNSSPRTKLVASMASSTLLITTAISWFAWRSHSTSQRKSYWEGKTEYPVLSIQPIPNYSRPSSQDTRLLLTTWERSLGWVQVVKFLKLQPTTGTLRITYPTYPYPSSYSHATPTPWTSCISEWMATMPGTSTLPPAGSVTTHPLLKSPPTSKPWDTSPQNQQPTQTSRTVSYMGTSTPDPPVTISSWGRKLLISSEWVLSPTLPLISTSTKTTKNSNKQAALLTCALLTNRSLTLCSAVR